MENKNVLIGDYLGTIEEFVPGDGTYAEEGKIYASTIGPVVIDRENH
jgi:exosome complex component CSL4